MRITAIREQTVPIHSDLQNAVIRFSEMTVSAVAILTDVVRDGHPLVGYGFHSNGRYGQSGLLRERFIPRLLRALPEDLLSDHRDNIDPFKAWRVMMANEKPGGHGERSVAVGTLDMALWDLIAKLEGQPLYRVLAGWYGGGEPDPDVYVYAAGGYYYPGKDVTALQDEIRRYLALGYDTVKIKIGGVPLDDDLRRIESVLEVVGEGSALAVDANGRFDVATALQYAEALAQYGLKWYEEPCDPLDYQSLAQVARASTTPIATGENLFSTIDTLNLIRYGCLNPERDFLQMDPALSYGLVEYLRTLETLHDNGWSSRRCIPHGGHQFALHLAAGLCLGGNESYPGVFEPFGGFADGIPVEGGRVRLPDAPGIGIEQKESLRKVFEPLSA